MATRELWSATQDGPAGTTVASLQMQDGGSLTLHLFDADAVELHLALSDADARSLAVALLARGAT